MAGMLPKAKTALTLLYLVVAWGCGSSGAPTTPVAPSTGELIPLGKLIFFDLTTGDQYDIFMADLVARSGPGSLPDGVVTGIEAEDLAGLKSRRGVVKIPPLGIDGRRIEGSLLYTSASFEPVPAGSSFFLRNLENLTKSSPADEYDSSVNSRGVLVYVRDPDGRAQDGSNAEIYLMDLADRVARPFTPVNGEYGGQNWDPEWKDDRTIVWVHQDRIIEASIDVLGSAAELLPDWRWPQFDPLYSPDGTKLLFNTWVRSKKNSYWKDLRTSVYTPVLPADVLKKSTDDNPAWIFSSTRIVGHAMAPKNGRLYIRDISLDTFRYLTDGTRDFRYVTPVLLEDEVQYVFSDYTDPLRPRLWTCREDGRGLRPLRYTGDEAAFALLGLSSPRSDDELGSAARQYVTRFAR